MATDDRWYEHPFPVRGALPPRAHLRGDAPRTDLGGSWRFDLAPHAHAPLDRLAPGHDDSRWALATVPGHWQLTNPDPSSRPAYTNVVYPFPLEPPFVPDENPTGDFRRTFRVPAGEGRVVLRFEGVDSAFSAHVDGTEVGRSVGSRLPVEFDVTDALAGGADDGREHLLAVRVHQWSSGSYLEDQDMWWLSGIFRDVALLRRPADGVEDVFVHAAFDGTGLRGPGRLRVDVVGGPARVRVPELGVDVAAGEEVALAAVDSWSAEVPRLYDVEVAAPGETVRLRVGFRTVAVRDGVFTVNGVPVTLHGVNRHEFSPERGRATTPADDLADVLAMKRHGIDAVRTSHYPPHPRFLDLCDEHGLYVVLENDLETHGFELVGWRGNPSDDPRFRDAYLDRVRRTVERDKNRASVVLWSLGNESGSGANLAATAAWVRDRDPSRPVHYENDHDYPDSDVVSTMYATHAEVAALLADDGAALRGKPYLQCEYAHAMGTGPGGLAEYQELFDSSPRCMGGLVWEWIDHGLAQEGPRGRRWAYGGDFGEPVHDGNFVADGLVLPDRTPSPGLLDLAAVIAPGRFRLEETPSGAALRLRNAQAFRDLGHCDLRWEVAVDGVPAGTWTAPAPDLAPGASALLDPPDGAHAAGGDGERWLTAQLVQRDATAWAPPGHVVATGQVRLAPAPAAPAGTPLPLEARDGLLHLGPATFDARTGELLHLGGLDLTGAHHGPVPELWRAPTDNDEGRHGDPVAQGWRALRLDDLRHRRARVEAGEEELRVTLRSAPPGTDAGLVTSLRWSAARTPAGEELRLRAEFVVDGDLGVPLPRLGLHLRLPGALRELTWCGRGPGEAYADTGLATRVGRFTAALEDWQTPRVRPQENGRRADVRRVELRGPGGGLRVVDRRGDVGDVRGAGLGVSARPWGPAALTAATHPDELADDGTVHLHLDVAQHGIGTGSCGPGALPAHRFDAPDGTVRVLDLALAPLPPRP